MKYLSILGSTGSIGESTLDVVRRHPDLFKIYALTAHRQVKKLAAQCIEFSPKIAVLGSRDAADELRQLLADHPIKLPTQVFFGPEALIDAVVDVEVDAVMAAIVGAVGLLPSLAAAKAGKQVLLANKEALVMSGKIFMNAVAQSGAILLPIDSEHNAIFQCLPSQNSELGYESLGVEEILLTASGGPFLNRPIAELAHVTPDQACAHPNWVMGRKISVDSATMMNKGLELIEAQWLFDLAPSKIKIVIHPQSVIHSMVRYKDGSILAQLGQPDMRTPIAYGLGWPHRIDAGVKPLELDELAELSFKKPDLERFPCLKLARQAAETGGTAPAILNAANEIGVESFLNGHLSYLGIERLVKDVLNRIAIQNADTLEMVLEADMQARVIAKQIIDARQLSEAK